MQSTKYMVTYIIGWEQENDVFKLARIREMKNRDLDHVKRIKSNDQEVLINDNDIKER